MKTRPWVAGAMPLLLFAAACSAGSAGTTKQVLNVKLTDFKVGVSTDAPAGKPLTLRVQNDGAVPHTLAIDAQGTTKVTPELAAGAATNLEVASLDAGTYKLYCTVAGHREAGMETTLTVAEGAAEASEGSEHEATEHAAPVDADQMDRMHEQGVKAFPAKTEALGGQIMQPKIVDGKKVFELTTARVRWEVSPGQFVDAMAYNGQIPGPELHVQKGDRVQVVLHNEMDQSTAIHFHGVDVPNDMDGVPFITQPPVRKGESFTYEFTIRDDPGTYMYHSHHNTTEQVGKGLLGAFIVDGAAQKGDVEATIVLGDGPLGFTLNGKGFPATQPVAAGLGQRVYVRFINGGQVSHPMHLHGFHFDVVARDGRSIAPYTIDTLSIGPGEVYDAVFTASAPGIWAFHCHILSHAESEHGMHGMVTALVVE